MQDTVSMGEGVVGSADSTQTTDPRILRSRQMLHNALTDLLRIKEFDKISIQEIAELSTLNRATFYSHYPDKFKLLQCMVGGRFQELMAARNVRVEGCHGALRSLALGVCDFLEDFPGMERDGRRRVEGSMQTAIVSVIEALVSEGVSRHPTPRGISAEMVAATIAWAIYGAASTWVTMPRRIPAEEMAEWIDRFVAPMMAA